MSETVAACISGRMPASDNARSSNDNVKVPIATVPALAFDSSFKVTALDTRTANALKAFGVSTVGDLAALLERPDVSSRECPAESCREDAAGRALC
jgi:hypothetical protein